MNKSFDSFENFQQTYETQSQDQKTEEQSSEVASATPTEVREGDKPWIDEALSHLKQELVNNNALLLEIRNFLESKIGANQNKDEAIIRMQKRLEDHEKGLIKSIKEPLLRDIILFYDSFTKFLEKFIATEFSQEFDHDAKILRDELLQVLFSQDVEIIEAQINGKYDRNSQKVIRTESTDKSEDNEVVCQINRDGFVWEGKTLRKQEVVVKKYVEKILD